MPNRGRTFRVKPIDYRSNTALQLRCSHFHNIRQTCPENNLAGGQVLGFKCNLGCAIGTFADLPNAGLQLVSGIDGGGKPHAEEFERVGVVAACGFEDSACCEAEGR